jgi:hypothetical protein
MVRDAAENHQWRAASHAPRGPRSLTARTCGRVDKFAANCAAKSPRRVRGCANGELWRVVEGEHSVTIIVQGRRGLRLVRPIRTSAADAHPSLELSNSHRPLLQ